MDPLVLGLIVFGVTYAAIVSDKHDRMVVAAAGALAMVVLGVVSQQQALESIDFNTIGLLIGMMIIVGILRQTGVFAYAGVRTARLAGGRSWPVLFGLVMLTAVVSAFLDNVTTVLLMVPVTLTIAEHLRIDPRPMLITQVLASNVGGTATLIGDPPNILVGSATGLDFLAFMVNLAPIVLAILVVMCALFWWQYGRGKPRGSLAAFADLDETKMITNHDLLKKSLVVLALTIVGFLLHGLLHLEPATVALGGATALMFVSRESIQQAFQEIEWGTILFFVSLFVVVGALERVGLLGMAGQAVVDLTRGNLAVTALTILWVAAAASAIVDNIPAVASLVPVVFAVARIMHPGVPDELLALSPDVVPLWWSLALGACLGGNATIVAASANVVVAGAAAKAGYRISFWHFAKAGLPITVLSLAMSSCYVYLRYLR